jgi:hypothetical protein
MDNSGYRLDDQGFNFSPYLLNGNQGLKLEEVEADHSPSSNGND